MKKKRGSKLHRIAMNSKDNAEKRLNTISALRANYNGNLNGIIVNVSMIHDTLCTMFPGIEKDPKYMGLRKALQDSVHPFYGFVDDYLEVEEKKAKEILAESSKLARESKYIPD